MRGAQAAGGALQDRYRAAESEVVLIIDADHDGFLRAVVQQFA